MFQSQKLSDGYKHFLVDVNMTKDPSHVTEVLRNSNWHAAMQSEINALEQNNIWVLTLLPSDKKALGCKLVIQDQKKK